jgi:hypothetical protein
MPGFAGAGSAGAMSWATKASSPSVILSEDRSILLRSFLKNDIAAPDGFAQ